MTVPGLKRRRYASTGMREAGWAAHGLDDAGKAPLYNPYSHRHKKAPYCVPVIRIKTAIRDKNRGDDLE